ncbi:hypothetical protein NKH52_28050 [Mesorhizobium sp. M1066]|uniref:hypothetical protein n=1 Tax=unclassified Mesorhizobium TaxID=325217 RepID=UPI00333DD88C
MGLSCLINRSEPIILDASVAINLNASGSAETILRAVPNDILITDIVLDELREDTRTGRPDRALTEALIVSGVISVIGISESDELEFERLVVGPGNSTLDDGEAATIAAAYGSGHIAIIDERKGRRICAELYPRIVFGDTCDVLAHPKVEQALGRQTLSDAVASALRSARMPIGSGHLLWAIDLIGKDAAHEFPSLRRHLRR